MKVTICNIKETLDAVVALEANKEFVDIDKNIDPSDLELTEWVDVIIYCDTIMVNDDLITVEFPDGNIAEYEISSDEYCRIILL